MKRMNAVASILIGITLSFSALSAGVQVTDGQESVGGEIKVPTQLSGVVSPLPSISFCMDGATHLMHSPIGVFRLKGRNDETLKDLESVSDGKKKVSVMGYPVSGPECDYISVYSVSEDMELLQ